MVAISVKMKRAEGRLRAKRWVKDGRVHGEGRDRR